jgi:murein DD-endopeptidase MepM/ murein hydrolase activator NlpD
MKDVNPEVLKMWESLGFSIAGGGMSYDEMVEAITLPGKATGLWDRLSAQSPEGSAFMRDRNVQSALAFPEDVNLQYQAINSRIAGMLGPGGMSLRQIIKSSGELQAVAGDEGAPEYILNQAIAAQAREALSYKMPFMGRTAGYSQQAGLFTDQVNMMAGDPRQQEAMNEAKAQFAQATIGQVQYFQQLLYQQREFEISQDRALFDFGTTRERMDEEYYISRERAQYDFHLQRQYQEHDYQLSRQRAEQDYDTQRDRAQDNFARSMRRGQQDFNISRRRQEEDYHHQVRLMVEQTAQQSLNIYERTATQRTASSGYLLFNAQDQLEQIQGQTNALDKLRDMGLTDDVIQQLGLTDAQNAQQAMRLATEAANNPEMIAQMNRAIRRRLRATRQLVTDESNKDWQEFQRQYSLSVSRAAEDFERSIRRARKDFGIQMNQMEDDFQLMMNRGAEDYETAQERQQRAFSMSMSRAAEDYARNVENMTEDFHRSMRRAKDDLERSSEEISGTMTQILNRAVRSLTGNAREQAIEVRRTMRGLRGELGESGNDIMTLLAAIFGFRYNPVDVQVGPPGTRQPNNDGYGPQEPGPSGHDGTVLPGRSIGRDNMHYYSPEHGGLHLAGGEAIMVPEWVDAVGGPAKVMEMNKAARYGRSFFLGGTMPTDASQITRHSPQEYDFATWAGDLNDPGSGDLGDPVKAWKKGTVAQVKDIGDTSYGRYIVINHGDQTSWYAHLSKFGVEPGDQVAAGQYIGNVGDYGRSYGPHLHFEVRGGSVAIGDMSGARTGTSASLSDVLKDRYADVERIAAEVGLGDPGGGLLFRPGRASSLLNRAARDTWKKLVKRYGAPQGQHGSMGQIPTAPQDLTGNKAIGKAIAERMGWDGAQWDALHELWMRESGWNHQADNPSSSAYGIPQALMALHDLPANYVGRTTGSGADMQGYGGDPEVQIRWGLNYIKNRYGDPLDALGFHDSNNWYAKGGVFDSPQMIGVGEAGPEMVLPLDSRGAHFISDIMSKMSVGNEGKASHLMGSTPMIVHNANTYHVDRSTTFSGPITVQANNPGQFLHQMQQRQRLMALSQSAIGGKRV